MRIGTLFSGIGSPEQGASRVYDNLDLVFACEWDKYARESFAANCDIPAEHFHQDISDMDGTQYKDKVDIIIGGSPCQDFSIAGLRAGVDGNKGILIYEYIRIIEEVSPPIFIYENVKGMLSDNGGRTIKEFVEAFREMGYYCHYEVLNTKDYGVPQNRERIFLVGFKCHDHYYNFSYAPKVKLEKRLKDLLEDQVDEKYYLSDQRFETLSKSNRSVEPGTRETEYAACLIASYNKIPTDGFYIKEPKIYQTGRGYNKGGEKDICPTITINSWEHNNHLIEPKILDFTNSFNEVDTREYTEFSPTLRSERSGLCVAEPQIGAIRGRNPDNPKSRTPGLPTEQMLEINEGGTSNCLTTVQKDNVVIEAFKIRKLTPRECFRLQDFPDTFKFVVSNSQLYKQAGNSISANVMEMIFNQVEKSRNGNTNSGSLF